MDGEIQDRGGGGKVGKFPAGKKVEIRGKKVCKSNLLMIYDKKSVKELKKIAQRHVNEYIRLRDAGEPCISCGNYRTLQAGHFIAAGSCDGLRFDLDNVNGQCKKCNYFLSGNQLEYRKNLLKKIGLKRVENLEFKRDWFKKSGNKWDRFSLLEIIEKVEFLKKV